jgi:hypothetical protein
MLENREQHGDTADDEQVLHHMDTSPSCFLKKASSRHTMKAPTITHARRRIMLMTYLIAIDIAGRRLFWYFLKLYFPEYSDKELAAPEYPHHSERFLAHVKLSEFLEKGPMGIRLAIFFDALDRRETEYFCHKKKPLPISEETNSIMDEVWERFRRWEKQNGR